MDGLRAEGTDALARLLTELPEPPWDVAIAVGDPLVSMLNALGFEAYGEVVTWVAQVNVLRPAPHVSGITIDPYRNEWTEGFQEAERLALEETVAFQEIGQPSGYEGAEGFDAFVVARRDGRIVGFAQAQLPEGWINWMGVLPNERRRGIGRLLVDAVARSVSKTRGTHVGAEVDSSGPGPAMWRAVGASEKGRRVLLVHRGPR
jgi:ribosomal protein S18 acetylase RimI-like enzyme